MKTLMALLVLLSGCEGSVGRQIPGDGTLVIMTYDEAFDRNFLPDGTPEAAGVIEGIHYWNQLGANLKLPQDLSDAEWAAASDSAPRFSVHRDQFSWPTIDHNSQPIGMCWSGLGFVTIYTSVLRNHGDTHEEQFREVVAHELGHAIGLAHVSIDDDAVMAPSTDYFGPKPEPADVAEYQRHYPPKEVL